MEQIADYQQGWDEIIEAVRALVAAGTKKAQIARMLDVDRSTITKWLSGYGGRKVAQDDMTRYRKLLGLPGLPSSPANAAQGALSTDIGRELAEIREQLTAAGLPEAEIQEELRAWLRARRADPTATPYGGCVREPHRASVQEPKKPYTAPSKEDDTLQT
ncbi:helix-turn-helix domain-containing protein [Desulfocurvus sp. DL9XJH121]